MGWKNVLSILGLTAVILTAVGAGIFAFSGWQSTSAAVTPESTIMSPPLSIGADAPDFEITTLEGKTVNLKTIREAGRPVVLYFWATWCPFCREDLKNLKTIYPEFAGKVDFVAIDMDLDETEAEIRNYKLEAGHAIEFAKGNQDILVKYNVMSTTTTYVVGPEGKIRYKKAGVSSAEEWRGILKSLL